MASPLKQVHQEEAVHRDHLKHTGRDTPQKQFPTIHDFLRTVDEEETDGDYSPNYSQHAEKLMDKGYRRIHLLFDETPKSLQTDLELPITIGDAKQLLMHVKRACQMVVHGA